MNKKIVINLFGGPGYGKSTCAAYLFSRFKTMQKYKVEMVTEYAKDLYYQTGLTPPYNQALVFGNQLFKIEQYLQHADIVIVDSPLLLSAVYNKMPYLKENFIRTVIDAFNYFNNINFLLDNSFVYDYQGRFQSEKDAGLIHENIRLFLNNYCIPFQSISTDDYDEIISRSINYYRQLNQLL